MEFESLEAELNFYKQMLVKCENSDQVRNILGLMERAKSQHMPTNEK